MYKQNRMARPKTGINASYEGISIEQKIARITQNREPITDAAPLIYTERKDGVQPAYDIRTDRFEIAVEAMDKASKSIRAKREDKPGEKSGDGTGQEGVKIDKKDTGGEPIQATE